MELTKDFTVQSFVSKDFYNKWKDKSIWFIDFRVVELAQFIKDFFEDYYSKPVIMDINTWFKGGLRNYSGFREPGSPYHRLFSQHSFGRAIDFQLIIDGKYVDIKEIYNIILENELLFRENGLTTLENIDFTYKPKGEGESSGWIHADIRWTGQTKLLIVNP